jgi:hypothetical protein
VVVETKGDGEGTAGGGMEIDAGAGADVLLGVEDGGRAEVEGCEGVWPDALSSLRAAFFLRRRTLRSCVAERP